MLISGLSLVGYALVKWLGSRRGLALTGLAGGLYSSTVVTLTMARDSKNLPAGAAALAIMLSWAMMFLRVLVEVSLVAPHLLRVLAAPMASMALACLGVAAFLSRHRDTEGSLPDPKTPFSLIEAMKIAAIFTVVIAALAAASRSTSDSAVLLVSVLGGAVDIDPVVLSVAQNTNLSPTLAAWCVITAAASNTIVKTILVAMLGTRRLLIIVTTGAALAAAVGIAAILLIS
ncbi:MAG: uncharacterized membrane protein (DUF4010 family) [Myxococcota bacterium]|jgi:uncharacterized membrane protein (DUF4010 family)